MTLAQDLSDVWASVRPVIEESFMADAYAIQRPTPTSDGRGGSTMVDTTVESGLCTLVASNAQGDEYVSGAGVVSRSPYWADMPWETDVQDSDSITINGRAFAVTRVQREGDWGVSVRADLEERG